MKKEDYPAYYQEEVERQIAELEKIREKLQSEFDRIFRMTTKPRGKYRRIIKALYKDPNLCPTSLADHFYFWRSDRGPVWATIDPKTVRDYYPNHFIEHLQRCQHQSWPHIKRANAKFPWFNFWSESKERNDRYISHILEDEIIPLFNKFIDLHFNIQFGKIESFEKYSLSGSDTKRALNKMRLFINQQERAKLC